MAIDREDIDAALARQLVDTQFPQWAGLEIRPVELDGRDNRTFRLGQELSVRLPTGAWYAKHAYPFPWSVYRWLPGVPAATEDVHAAVIDFGTSGVGDPAYDVVLAFTYLRGRAREAFRTGLGVDAGTWSRGRGWALWKALITGDLATVGQVLADYGR